MENIANGTGSSQDPIVQSSGLPKGKNVAMALPKIKGNGTRGKLAKGLGLTGIIVILLVAAVLGVGYAFLIRPAYALVSSGNKIQADIKAIGDSVVNRDLVELDKVLTQMQSDLNTLRTERDTRFGWAKNLSLFHTKEFYSDSDRFINAGLYAIEAMRELAAVSMPFADAAGLKVSADQVVVQTEGLMEAFQTWVSIMPQVADQMDGVIAKVSKVGEELEPIDVSKYPVSFRGVPIRENIEFLRNTLSQSKNFAPDIKQALTLIPTLLGVDGSAKRYMIIMQNDKEIRPTGGFMTNYATFKVRNGLLDSDFSSKDMYSIDLTLDLIDATYDFPDAPAPYTKYLKVERWYARDMNYSPDFVSSMDQFLRFYNMAGRLNPIEIKPVDGIIAINTHVISELLDVTGPVTVNGVTYTSENVVLELERIASLALKEQAGRKKVLGDMMEAMLSNVFESDKNLWPKLIDKGVDLTVRKHILVYVFDPQSQTLLEKYNIGGRILDPVEGDYSYVVSTNLGGDKTNWFTTKDVTHELSNSNGRWVNTVKVKYTYKQPSDDYAPFVKRFRDWVRVYAPLGSELISVEGSEDGTTTDQERGKVFFSGYVELGPDETKELKFSYYLPESVIKQGANKYSLTIQKQSGIDHEAHQVIVKGKTTKIDLYKDVTVSLPL